MSLFKYWSRISPKQAETINQRRVHGILLKVTPSRDELSLNELAELLKPLCLPKKKSIMEELTFWRTYDLCSFEIVSRERNVNFYIWSESRDDANRLRNALNARYPNARITEAVEPIFTVNEGEYVSGGVVEFPLMDGLKVVTDYNGDPLDYLCETLSHIKSTCIIQVLFKPMELSWIHREQLKPLREIKKYDLKEPRFQATLNFCTVSRYPHTALKSSIMIGDFFRFTAKSHVRVKPSRALPLMNPVKLLGDMVRKKYPILLGSRFFIKPEALSTLIHLPSEYGGSGILQAYPSFPPPPLEEKPDIMLGDVVYRGEKYGIAGLSEEDVMRSVYVCGGAGTGKSVLLINMALQLLRKGHAIHVIDFHGDLSEDMIRSIEPENLDKVYLFDPTRFLFSTNPFEIPASIQGYERDVIVEKIIGETTELIKRLFGPQFWGPSAQRLCSDALRLAYKHKKNITYVDVYDILEGRGDLASTPEVKNFVHEIRRLPVERIDSVLNKLNFVKNPMIRSLFCQPSSVDFDELMKPSRLVLWRLPKGELSTFNSTLIASSIVTKIWFHIISRSRQKRNPIILILDEFQNVFSGGLTLIDTMLSEQRKFGLAQILSHQTVSQIPKETLSIVLSNTGSKILFREPSDGSRVLGRNIDSINYEKIVDALINLPDGSALVKKRAGFGEQANPVFQIETLKPPEEKPNDVEGLVNRMKERYQVPVVELPSGVEQEATPDVIDLLKIVHKLEEKGEEATVGRTLDEFRRIIPHMKGSRISSICDVAQSSGLIERNIVKQEAQGRPKIVLSLLEKGRQKIGIGVEMGGRKGGGDLHRTVIWKLSEKLKEKGCHVEIPLQAGTGNQPDLISYRRSETGGWTQETAWEVETNPAKHPEQVRKNMMKALESGREIVFVVLNEGAKKSLHAILGEAAKDVKIIVFNPDEDSDGKSNQPQ